MKNNGVLKFILVLAFCGVLSMYALTAESITRLDIDAEKVSGVMYCENLKEGTGIDIETPEHMTQIATAMNQMELKKTVKKQLMLISKQLKQKSLKKQQKKHFL